MTHLNPPARLDQQALSRALTEAGMTLREFCLTFDVRYETGRRWLAADTAGRAMHPPYWVTPMLEACRDPEFKARAKAMRATYAIKDLPSDSEMEFAIHD